MPARVLDDNPTASNEVVSRVVTAELMPAAITGAIWAGVVLCAPISRVDSVQLARRHVVEVVSHHPDCRWPSPIHLVMLRRESAALHSTAAQ